MDATGDEKFIGAKLECRHANPRVAHRQGSAVIDKVKVCEIKGMKSERVTVTIIFMGPSIKLTSNFGQGSLRVIKQHTILMYNVPKGELTQLIRTLSLS